MRTTIIILTAVLSLTPASARAQWHNFGGPSQDFSIEGFSLAEKWPDSGPKALWSRKLGEGYSAILVDDNRLFTMYREGDHEITIALAADTGETLWQHRYPEPVNKEQFAARYNHGPRSTPLIASERIFAIGFNGRLTCLDKTSGREIWTVKLLERFDAKPTRWGYANSPLAFENTIIVPVGGEGASIVALNQSDGRIVWQRHDFENSYGSPILIDVGGQPQAVVLMAREVIGLNPKTGGLLWRHPHEGQWRNNIPNPVWCREDNLLFVTSEGDAGSRVLKLTRDGDNTGVQEIWAERKFRVVHRNVIRMNDMVFGSSGDFGKTIFTAIDIHTGHSIWKRRDIDRAGLLRVGEKLLMLEETGRLTLATPSREGLLIHAQATVLEEPAWTIPTLIGKVLYLRDQKKIKKVEVPLAEDKPVGK